MILRWFALIIFSVTAPLALAENSNESYAFAQLGEPKYATDFSHYDYVNPAAPKGGDIVLSAIGTYDNFNRYASRGNPAAGSETLYDTLFVSPDDEAGSYYPLIAEFARYPDSFRWLEVTLKPQARFQDGTPMTAKDAAFTFNKFMTEGVPQFRVVFKGVTAKAITGLTVRFDLPESDRDKMLSLLTLPVFPEKFWQDHKLNEPLATPPPASGPYRISRYKVGQSVTYSRVKDYWAADLPVNKGLRNFDTLRYDYYLDDNVAFEAFKAGAFDFRAEGSAKKWATQYQGKNFSNHYIVKDEQPNKVASATTWLAFNVQKPLFNDRRVREAISLVFDFEWMNRTLFYGAYKRTNSYFQNTEYAARNYPDAKELEILAPFKGKIPDEVFSQIYQPSHTDGSGYDRDNLLKALDLLKQAGWQLKNQRLVNVKTGVPFSFELLTQSGGNDQWILPFQHNLTRIGIKLNIRQVDSSQYLARLRKSDFDMLMSPYPAMPFPDSGLQMYWATQYINSSYNRPHVSNPVIDNLLAQISQRQGNKAALLPLGRALDRVLLWNFYMIPMWHSANDRYAWWNKFSMPETRPTWSSGFDSWWYDVNKAAQLPAQRR
ncbi:extracellular solute-binding protein [Erwinia psidii]|uniref:ABC transporter substrate-binding protein n=1 Tax=Erwinia psidii TaxID=69224 RepID=A0A3N6SLX2_9GAMM|nr:extracellular solute-binding protein [Erwinia psidii]MCX8956532.1 ABC transporter substrate-binding protein [Erwinia psidii]MCX8966778.1 ABC transporter substrate-binding protein [Erwinia psidii]RQM39861.1 ABC transporter substrate-binding protein [Erwinia psidii]